MIAGGQLVLVDDLRRPFHVRVPWYLSVKEIVPCDFLIATTSLVNGTTMLSPFVDDSVPTDNFAGEEQ